LSVTPARQAEAGKAAQRERHLKNVSNPRANAGDFYSSEREGFIQKNRSRHDLTRD